jgi:hypothetical protein
MSYNVIALVMFPKFWPHAGAHLKLVISIGGRLQLDSGFNVAVQSFRSLVKEILVYDLT